MLTKLHVYLGLILLLPLSIWGVTGLVFLIKPGYTAAYSPPSIKTLPLEKYFAIPKTANWHEAKYVRSSIGWHLLVEHADGSREHLNPQTLEPWPYPILELVKKLLNESIEVDPDRYGRVESLERQSDRYIAQTTTGVTLTLNWQSLELTQTGKDTRFLNRLYRLHYLQWTPNPVLNMALAVFAILGLFAMCLLSLKMLISVHKWES